MRTATEEGYKVPPGFEADTRQPLDDLALNDTSEIWLIQWPLNQFPEFDGKEVTLKLHQDGQLGTVEDLSEKTYDVVSYAAQDADDARVILPSESESKIVGKISRRVALVRYPEPDELEKMKSKTHQRSTGSSQANSSYILSTPAKSHHRQKSSQSGWGNPASSSKHKSSMSGISSERSKSSKRKKLNSEQAHSSANLSGSSGRAISSATTVSGSSERSRKE